MNRLEKLKNLVSELYLSKKKGKADWADWLFENHVFQVADEAERLCERFGGNKNLAVAAAMLHDIADAVVNRFDSNHEQESLKIAEDFLIQAGFSKDEINIIVNDIIKLHSCRSPENSPKTLEGKVIATADAVVHLQTDFYNFGMENFVKEQSLKDALNWAIPKIERDFHQKIMFPEIREENKDVYENLKHKLSILV